MQRKIDSPLWEVLSALTGEDAPIYTKNKFNSSELSDEEHLLLQEWCASHCSPDWATGISIIDSADTIVSGAVDNANIVGDC